MRAPVARRRLAEHDRPRRAAHRRSSPRFTPSSTGPHAFAGETREHLYKVYAPGDLLIQVVRGEQTGTIFDQAVLYVHADQQGSPAVIRDQNGGDHGQLGWTTTGGPSGSASWDSTADPLARTVRTTYTGHEFDEELGLTNMRGRIYDQKSGRFLEADPVVQAPYSTQGLNRYSYAFNSPLNFVDPSGFDIEILVCGSNRPPECGGYVPPDPTASADLAAAAEGAAEGRAAAAATASSEASAAAAAQAAAAHASDANSQSGQPGADDFARGQAQRAAGVVSQIGRGSAFNAMGAFESQAPFGTLFSQIAQPTTPQDRINLGLGQLAGSSAVFGEAGGIAGGGLALGLTVIGAPEGLAAEVAAAAVAVGGAVNALSGIYNIARGKLEEGGGGDKSASTPTGRRGSPMNVPGGTNEPTTIDGRQYTGHALDQMQGRGLTPTVVEDAIRNGTTSLGNQAGTFQHDVPGVRVITNSGGGVITVIPQ